MMDEKSMIDYLQKALSIRDNISDVNWDEVETEIKDVLTKHVGYSPIKQEAVLRNISAVYSVRQMRKSNNLFEDRENQVVTL